MPNSFTTTTFNTTYRDDFKDSDHYHRILFNSGKALQARELTQLQTITQTELERLGRHIFKEGSVVNPGGLTVDRNYEFVKLETSNTSAFVVGDVIQGQTSSVQAKILQIVAATSSDPATFYVKYINSSTSSGTVTSAVRFTPGESVQRTTSSDAIQVQVTNTGANPAIGVGSRATVNGGSYFTNGHFVSVTPQTVFVSKYSGAPTEVIGMKIVEDVVTTSDTNALYDNQNNGIANLTAPGADRYRITLTLAIESTLATDDNFFPINRLVDGILMEEVDETEYNKIGSELAVRTKEESGDYVVQGYTSKMKVGDSDSVLNLSVQPGVAYIDGYRTSITGPTNITVNKPRTTEVVEETVAANYGNYVKVTAPTGFGFVPDIQSFSEVTLKSAVTFGSTTIGTARVRSVAKDGANYRLYLFDIQIASGQKFSAARSIGKSTTEFFNLITENGVAVIKEAVNNNLFFDLGKTRPSLVDDLTITVQRRFTGSTNSSGVLTLSGLGTDESFSNQTSWIVGLDSAGGDQILPNASASGAAVTTGRSQVDVIEVLALVDKTSSAVTVRPKTRTVVTETGLLIESDGAGFTFVKLSNPDIFKLTSVIDSATSVPFDNRFTVDNGQRDNFYYNGRLILRKGVTAPAKTAPMTVAYEHFAHGAGDLFAINSYNATDIGYQNIPKHRQANGTLVDLRDTLDFRPYKESDGASYSASNMNELPQNTDTIATDVTYYKGRNDILVLTPEKVIKYVEGVAALDNTLTPNTPSGTLKLKEFQLNAYTDDLNDLTETFIQNRRFTMRDISGIVNRIDNLEEVVTLNLLEQQTATIEVLDSSGNNRFKNGFFADNFSDFAFSDVDDEQYTASMDLENTLLLPDVVENNVPLVYDSVDATSVNTKLSGELLTLDFASEVYINQDLASETENINPFEVITFTGQLRLSPEIDEWREVRSVNRTITRIRSLTFTSQRGRGVVRRLDDFTETTTVTGGRVTLLPNIRSRLVFFKGEALKPNTRHFLFFDNVLLTNPSGNNYTREEADFVRFSRRSRDQFINSRATSHPLTGSDLYTDNKGEIIGSFLVPNNSEFIFDAGEREVKLIDVSVNDDAASTSFAAATYSAQGTRRVIVSTTVREGTIIVAVSPRVRDPLAQSFQIQNSEGAFVTKIDVYFSTRPAASSADENIPVRLELRPLRNGVPAQDEMVIGSQVVKQRADINIPSDLDDLTTIRATPTTFEFDAPVYLPGNTPFALILQADTVDYNVYVAKAGDFIIGTTDRRIRQQPSLGSLFMSQNAITWTPDQTRDMMFRIHRANFVSSGAALIENIDLPDAILDSDAISTDSGSTTVTILQRGHGFGIDDYVNIYGLDSSTSYAGIKGSSILGKRNVTAIDGTGFKFVADSAATSTQVTGGSNLSASQNIQMDLAFPLIESFLPAVSANLTMQGSFAKGRSIVPSNGAVPNNKSKNTFALSSNFDIVSDNPVLFDFPQVVANRQNEDSATTLLAATNPTPRKSVKITANMATSSNFISPVIFMDNAQILTSNNVIDNQDSATNVFPLNTPFDFVDETDPTNGSTLSKHITPPVVIDEPAVGLKVIIAANRPDGANFDLYFRTSEVGSDINIDEVAFVKVAQDTIIQTDENRDIFRDYEYTIGNLGGELSPFTTFQLKIVMRSSNSSKITTFRDLRAIALGT